MTAPDPIWLYHITHVEHLASIARDGLHCDANAHVDGRLAVEIGNVSIKTGRRSRQVPVPPSGYVSDYVPFYFTPRTPMLFAIHKGNVSTYVGGQEGIVVLCTTLDEVERHRIQWVASDRNAAMRRASFTSERAVLHSFIDWDVIAAPYWDDFPEGGALRQAELLVHHRLPWEAVKFIGTRTAEDLKRANVALDTVVTPHRPRADVRGRWYF